VAVEVLRSDSDSDYDQHETVLNSTVDFLSLSQWVALRRCLLHGDISSSRSMGTTKEKKKKKQELQTQHKVAQH